MTVVSRVLFTFVCLLSTTALAVPPIESYGRLPEIEKIRLSPSGIRYSIVTVVDEQRAFAVLSSTPGKKAEFASRIGDIKLRDVYWASDEHVLVEYSETYSNRMLFQQNYELSSVISVRVPQGDFFRVFDNRQRVANAVFGYYGSTAPAAQTYGYFGAITYALAKDGSRFLDQTWADLYRVDLDKSTISRVAKGSYKHQGWLVGRDGKVSAHARYDEETGAWQLFSGKDRSTLLMERNTPLGSVSLLGFGRRPGTLLVLDQSGDRDRLIEFDLADRSEQDLCQDMSVDDYAVDPDSTQLLGCLSDEPPYAEFFDNQLQQRLDAARKAFPRREVSLESYSRNFDHLVIHTDGGDDSGTYWLVDMSSREAKPIGFAFPDIPPAEVAPAGMFRYEARDGMKIEGVLTLPRGREARSLPLVMMPHGGPLGVADRPGFDWWAQAFASRGYAVFQPNYRGSAGRGRAFHDLGYGEWGGKMLDDIADGLVALAGKGIIDPKRACIVGASYGGYAALAGVTLQQGLYRCAVSVSGPAEMIYFLRWERDRHGNDSDETRFFMAALGASKANDPALRAISPALAAGKADAPILLIHGKDDTVVPIEHSRRMAKALKAAKKDYEFKVLDGEDHWLSREKTRIELLRASVDFLKRHNPPD